VLKGVHVLEKGEVLKEVAVLKEVEVGRVGAESTPAKQVARAIVM
jgi:hypothetical protein